MRTTLVLPVILTLMATSLPARSAMDPTSELVATDIYTHKTQSTGISGSDINELFSNVRRLSGEQEKDSSTIAELNSRIKSLESQNGSLQRSQEDLSRRLDDLSRKVK